MITVAAIQRSVASEFNVPFGKMREPAQPGRRRTNGYDVSHPRQIAMCLSMRLTEHSLVRVGHFFGGRDHTTVRHAYLQVERRSRTDEKLRDAMRRLTLELLRKDGVQ